MPYFLRSTEKYDPPFTLPPFPPPGVYRLWCQMYDDLILLPGAWTWDWKPPSSGLSFSPNCELCGTKIDVWLNMRAGPMIGMYSNDEEVLGLDESDEDEDMTVEEFTRSEMIIRCFECGNFAELHFVANRRRQGGR